MTKRPLTLFEIEKKKKKIEIYCTTTLDVKILIHCLFFELVLLYISIYMNLLRKDGEKSYRRATRERRHVVEGSPRHGYLYW